MPGHSKWNFLKTAWEGDDLRGVFTAELHPQSCHKQEDVEVKFQMETQVIVFILNGESRNLLHMNWFQTKEAL